MIFKNRISGRFLCRLQPAAALAATVFIIALLSMAHIAPASAGEDENQATGKRPMRQITQPMTDAQLEYLLAQIPDAATPKSMMQLFEKRKRPDSIRLDLPKYNPMDDKNAMAFMRALLAHVRERHPAEDAWRYDSSMLDPNGNAIKKVIVLHGHTHSMYGFTSPHGIPAQYHNPGVACDSKQLYDELYYQKFSPASRGLIFDANTPLPKVDPETDYLIEDEFISAFSEYLRAFNRALIKTPDYKRHRKCSALPDDSSIGGIDDLIAWAHDEINKSVPIRSLNALSPFKLKPGWPTAGKQLIKLGVEEVTRRQKAVHAMIDELKGRDAAKDAAAAAQRGDFRIYLLHGDEQGISSTVMPAHLPDLYTNAGVGCMERQAYTDLYYLITVADEKRRTPEPSTNTVYHHGRKANEPLKDFPPYTFEQEYIAVLSSYIEAYNRAVFRDPRYPNPHICVEMPQEIEVRSERVFTTQANAHDWHNIHTKTSKDVQVSTPHLAAHFGRADVFGGKFTGAALNKQDAFGHSPAYYAIKAGRTETLRAMIAAGMDLNAAATRFGWTLLHVAARYGRVEIARMLLDAGADIVTLPYTGAAQEVAIRFDKPEVLDLLLAAEKKTNDAAQTAIDIGAVKAATHQQSIDTLAKLVAKGAPLDYAWDDLRRYKGYDNPGDLAPLGYAMLRGNMDVAAWLLDHGADPNSFNISLLGYAIENDSPEMVRRLLDAGARPNGLWGRDGTALRAALHLGRIDIADILLDAGADPGLVYLEAHTESDFPAKSIRWLLAHAPEGYFPPNFAARMMKAEELAGDQGLEVAVLCFSTVQLMEQEALQEWYRLMQAGAVRSSVPGRWQSDQDVPTAESFCHQGHFHMAANMVRAVIDGRRDIFSQIVAAEADINDIYIARELFASAARGGRPEAARAMLDHGFSPLEAREVKPGRFWGRFGFPNLFEAAIYSGEKRLMQRVYGLSIKGQPHEFIYLLKGRQAAYFSAKRYGDDTALKFLQSLGMEVEMIGKDDEIPPVTLDDPFLRDLLAKSLGIDDENAAP